MIKKSLIIFFILFTGLLFSKAREWKIYGSMPIPVAGAEIVTYNEKIYILGGYQESNGEPISAIQLFDPAECLQHQWQVVGDMQVPRANFVARLYGDKIYISGGITGRKNDAATSMEVWNLDGNNGNTVSHEFFMNRIGATGEIWKDFLLIIGGYNSFPVGYIAAYHLGLDENIGQLPSFSNQEPYQQSSVLVDDDIYIFGGVRSGVSDRIYKLNLDILDGDFWPPINIGNILTRIQPDLPFPRAAMQAVKTEPDTVWLIGGYNEEYNALDSVNKFVIRSNGYEHIPGPSLNVARKEMTATMLDTVLYVFGGLDEHGHVLDTVEALINSVIIDSCETNVVDKKFSEPTTFRLLQNYPNPFNNSTTIEFQVTTATMARLDIFSSRGELVTSLLNNTVSPGVHRVVWDGRSSAGDLVPSGVYIYQLTTDLQTESRKMLIVK